MEGEQHSSVLVRILSVAFFLVFSLAALVWFAVSISDLVSHHFLNRAVVSFDKGAMYMLGAGLGGLLFTIGGMIQGILGRKLTPKAEVFFNRGLIISLILMFGFPQLTHYAVAKYAQAHSYSLCGDATYRWLLYSKFYYTRSDVVCNDLVSKKSNKN